MVNITTSWSTAVSVFFPHLALQVGRLPGVLRLPGFREQREQAVVHLLPALLLVPDLERQQRFSNPTERFVFHWITTLNRGSS